ncbi:NAD(P)-binding Rossmann-fold containing protein [Glarea lozoyensis ATCC 20868]|uniref:NAD(P)-binding Rossmann-fold containing protein n=1 Tax=Glarea lozoyensis (strain ATCC 20868 / MF5171) TaxID=1116229 RepID=S3CHA3_GLAL2|nr:NAD(P)-binding Rossmann-fold containing protein [Glarea lozoyensis ATCC 20868]EPE25837.1 NAD(P)-binding Rossmann-fold containing protein [Glarea lozoyensis ATCC 20868]
MALRELPGIALITGAGSGIGRDSAFAFAAAGVRGILLTDINLSTAEQTLAECRKHATNPSFRAVALKCDVRQPEQVDQMITRCVAEFGRIDYGVHCAGIGRQTLSVMTEASTAASLQEYDLLYSVNVKGTLLVLGALCKQMATQESRIVTGRNGPRNVGRGSIVCLSSGNGYVAEPNKGAYTTMKHAIMAIMKTAALENAALGIRVNALCPAWTETPMHQRDTVLLPMTAPMIEKYTPLGRTAMPEEVGDTIVFLCSDSASYITGTGLMIDGGVSLSLHVG